MAGAPSRASKRFMARLELPVNHSPENCMALGELSHSPSTSPLLEHHVPRSGTWGDYHPHALQAVPNEEGHLLVVDLNATARGFGDKKSLLGINRHGGGTPELFLTF